MSTRPNNPMPASVNAIDSTKQTLDTDPVIGRFAYGVAVALSAGLLSFVVAVLLGRRFSSGEAWEVFTLIWVFFGVVAATSAGLVYPFYVDVSGRTAAACIFTWNVLVLAGCCEFATVR